MMSAFFGPGFAQIFNFWILVFVVQIQSVLAGDHEKLLYNQLQHGYNKLARPVKNDSNPVIVKLGLDLQQIIDVDEKAQTVTTNVWLRMTWTDAYLSWDPSEYGGIKEVRLPIEIIWKPDVLLYNSVEQRFDTMWPVNSIVTHNGNVTWIPPAIAQSSCRISITWFPFDEQDCVMKFGSWSYSSIHIDLYNMSVSLDPYVPNGEWILLKAESVRNVRYYDCCPSEPYNDVTFMFQIRRRTLYYGFNLVIPSVLISSLALLSFTLPPDCGEKLNLGVTILVSLSIFMVMVAETMPQTADSLPLIAVYFTSVMFEVGASVVCTVIVLNLHHRNAESYFPMSRFQRKVFLHWLPWMLCMRRPPRIRIPGGYDHLTAFKKPLELLHPTTKQAAAMVPLDNLEVDKRLLAHPRLYGKTNGFLNADAVGNNLHLETCTVKRKKKTSRLKGHIEGDENLYFFTKTDPSVTTSFGGRKHSKSPSNGLLRFDFDPPIRTPVAESPATSMFLESPETSARKSKDKDSNNFESKLNDEQFHILISHLRILTARTQKEELMHEVRAEWVFASRVLDRICFISFTFFMTLCISIIVWHAPHLVV